MIPMTIALFHTITFRSAVRMTVSTVYIDIFDYMQCDAWVNPINTVGVMGAGLAKQFADRFPGMLEFYQQFCAAGLIEIGKLYAFRITEGCPFEHPKYIILFPTKKHWKNPSKYEYLATGFEILEEKCQKLGISRVAMPKLGCGLGGLDWEKVFKMIREKFADSDLQVILCIR